MAKKQIKQSNEIEVTRDEESVTASLKHEGDASDLSNDQFNKYAGMLLAKLATEIVKEKWEFNGVEEPIFANGKMSLTANLFIP